MTRLASLVVSLSVLGMAIVVGSAVRRLVAHRKRIAEAFDTLQEDAQQVLVAECVGSTSFGGEWEMDEETEARLVSRGWEKPWLPDGTTFVREAPLVHAPRLALATVRALELLGCDPDDIEVERVREEPD